LERELAKDLEEHSREHGLEVKKLSSLQFHLGGKGIDLTFKINKTSLNIRGDINFPASMFSGRIKDGFEEGMPKLMDRCEKIAART